MSVTDEIKSRLDIVEVISDYLPLRKSGRSYTGFCPFHPNTRTPAFVVFPGSQTWRCFGACAEGGDVFSFVMKREGWDFKEALAHLAQRAGVILEKPSPAEKVRQAEDNRLVDLLTAAAEYYHDLFLYAPQAENARQYVANRGLTDESIKTFRIGYALDSWDACRLHFNMQGYDDEDLEAAGLLTSNPEKETRYDRFRNRLMIPIQKANGDLVGFGARTLDPDGLPKYLNSPQTAIFDKGRLLFGLNLARRHIRQARQVVIVEGYMDVMQAWQAGFHNVVAQMGTAFTEAQLRLVKRYARRLILALDADAAGSQATLRSLEIARESLEREPDMTFDARGLVRQEGRLRADIRVVTLPEGSDPDDIIRADPTTWSELIEGAQPVVAYVIDVATSNLNLEDAKAKTEAAQQILPVIGDVVDAAEREHYIQLLARRLQIDPRVLYKIPASSRSRRSTPTSIKPTNGRTSGKQAAGLAIAVEGKVFATAVREDNFLRQCLRYPDIVLQIDQRLSENQQEKIRSEDFTRPDDRALWDHIRDWTSSHAVVSSGDLCDSLEDEILQQRVQSLLEVPETEQIELARLSDRLLLSVLDWRAQKVKSLIGEVEALFQEAEALRRKELMDIYGQQLQGLLGQLARINRARATITATGRR